MNETPDHDSVGARAAAAFARRAATATLPAPELDHLRALAGRPPASTGRYTPWVARGLAAAAAAVVLAGGTYVVLESRTGSPTVSTVDLTGGAPVVLRRVADVAAAIPVVVPRPDQFVYTRLVGEGIPKGSPTDYAGPLVSMGSEVWTAQADGVDSLAVYSDGTRVPIGHDIASDPGTDLQMPTYADLARIPTDPAGLRAYLDGQFPGEPVHGAELLLGGNLVPPALASAIYRVLADVPGLTVDPGVVDAAGRPGVGISQTDRVGGRHELIFDRGRLRLTGTRTTGPTGQVTASVAFLEQSVVDEAGDRPR